MFHWLPSLHLLDQSLGRVSRWLQRKTVVSFYMFFFLPFLHLYGIKDENISLSGYWKVHTHTLQILDIIPCIASVVGNWKRNTHFKHFNRKLEAAAAQCLEWTNFVFDVCGLICLFTFSYFLSFWRVVLFFFWVCTMFSFIHPIPPFIWLKYNKRLIMVKQLSARTFFFQHENLISLFCWLSVDSCWSCWFFTSLSVRHRTTLQ